MKNQNTGHEQEKKGDKELKNAIARGAAGGASRAITSKAWDWVSGLISDFFDSEE
ncbi:hypothetical protein ABWU59_29600 [Priestia megaterium]|uniref:hypothetical protein n=1 Tax=Priestia megaterium TaxID=1404 RepID=UPI0033911A8F